MQQVEAPELMKCKSCSRLVGKDELTAEACLLCEMELDNPEAFGPEGYSEHVCSCGDLATHDHEGKLCCGGMMCCPEANR